MTSSVKVVMTLRSYAFLVSVITSPTVLPSVKKKTNNFICDAVSLRKWRNLVVISGWKLEREVDVEKWDYVIWVILAL